MRAQADRHRDRRHPAPCGKPRIIRQLEGLHPARLQAVRHPDALHAAVADTGGFRHRPAGPVRPLARRFEQRHLVHPLNHCRRQRRLARGRVRVASCSKPSTPSAMKRACQRQIVGFLCRSVAGSPSRRPRQRSAAQSVPATHASADCCPSRSLPPAASGRPGPAGPRCLFLIPPDSHLHEPAGTIRQWRSALMSAITRCRRVNSGLACKRPFSGSSGQGRRRGRRNDGRSYSDARVGTA
jgi:hypothetical protein